MEILNKPLYGDYNTPINTPAEIALVTAIALCILALYPNRNNKSALLSITATLTASSIALSSITTYKENDRINRLLAKIENIYNSLSTTLSQAADYISKNAPHAAEGISNKASNAANYVYSKASNGASYAYNNAPHAASYVYNKTTQAANTVYDKASAAATGIKDYFYTPEE